MFDWWRRRRREDDATTVASVVNHVSGSARDVVQAHHIDQVVVATSPERDNVQVLRDVTDANLRSLEAHSRVPSGVRWSVVERPEVQELAGVSGSFVITGEPGCGKSGAVFRLAKQLQQRGEEVVLLTVETLGEVGGAVRGDVVLSRGLRAVLTDWPATVCGTVLIDGVDASRGSSLGWLANLVADLAETRWRVVATMRRFDLIHGTVWRQAFAGRPVSESDERRDSRLAEVRHFVLGDFSVAELERLATDDPHIGRLVDGADAQLLRLVRHPFNLRLACELLHVGEPALSLANTRDQLQLLQRYWSRRVLDQLDGEGRARVLTMVTEAMLTQRRLHASSTAVPEALLDAFRAVLRDGVLTEVPGRLLASGSTTLVFSHHILFDYAVAALILVDGDRSRLIDVLHADPNLVFVARPSVDFHFADLWQADATRRDFARVVINLAEAGHNLAGVAAASVLVAETRQEVDLQWLAELVEDGRRTSVAAMVLGWAVGAMEAAGEPSAAERQLLLEPWTALARRTAVWLGQHFDNQLANQLFRLLHQLQRVHPIRPGTLVAEDRAETVASVMTIALAAPSERGWLGDAIARFLPDAVEVQPVHAVVLRRTLTPELMMEWPSTYLHNYVEKISTITRADSQLAAEVLIAIWRFREDRDDRTPMVRGVLNISSTRERDINLVKWSIGEKFSEFVAAAGLRPAVPVLAAVTTTDSEPSSIVPAYPLAVDLVVGQVDCWPDSLRSGGRHDAALAIVTSFAKALRAAPLTPDEARLLVADLVSSIRHPEAWHQLLRVAAGQPAVLGRAFATVLLSAGLLANYITRASACRLLRSIAPHMSDGEIDELEAAILQAPWLPDNATDERRNAILDQIVTSLDPSRVRHPDLVARLARLTAAGTVPDVVDDSEDEIGEVTAEPATLNDYLGGAYDDLAQQEHDTLDLLRRTIDAAESTDSDARADMLDALKVTLRCAIYDTVDLLERIPQHPARALLIRAVDVLIRHGAPAPDSPLGELVISLLLNTAKSGTSDDEVDGQP